jgi:hypothetical protein
MSWEQDPKGSYDEDGAPIIYMQGVWKQFTGLPFDLRVHECFWHCGCEGRPSIMIEAPLSWRLRPTAEGRVNPLYYNLSTDVRIVLVPEVEVLPAESWLDPDDQRTVREWVQANREALLEFAEQKIAFDDLMKRICK